MTAIMYPDCEASSGNGKFILRATSPHNGTIDHRDGTRPTDDEFAFKYRQHQGEFRYRLVEDRGGEVRLGSPDSGRERVIWERWQGPGEDSPHEVLVSDEGWSILRTHGFRPEVIAVSRKGEDVLRVRICGEEVDHPGSGGRGLSWRPERLSQTTAGHYWSGNSRAYFLSHEGRPHFCWRTSWGQRLLIDLGKARLVSEAEQATPNIALALQDVEKLNACRELSALSSSMDEIRSLLASVLGSEGSDPLREKIASVPSAIHMVGVYRLTSCMSLLRQWEEFDLPRSSTGSTAMRECWVETQFFRPILHHSLRLLGEEPLGYPTYHFRENDRRRFPLPERITDRDSRTLRVDRTMLAGDVLRLLGSPDHITRQSHKVGVFYRWTERWEYDHRLPSGWETFAITWEEAKRKGRIAGLDRIPSEWERSDERSSQILDF